MKRDVCRRENRTVKKKKIVNVFVNYSGTGRDISNIPADLDSTGQKQFSE
jgi:hypothetical protein